MRRGHRGAIARHGGLLSPTESLALIEEVDRWSRRTGTNYNKLVVAARIGTTTRHGVWMGKCLSKHVADKIVAVLNKYPHGITRDEYKAIPKPWRRVSPPRIELVRVSAEICRRCGAREGRCEHTRVLNAEIAGDRLGA